MQKEIVFAIGISLVLMVGMVSATTGDMVFSEQINRPGNFVYVDNAQLSGWNDWSHSSTATAGTFNSISQFKTLDVPCNAAPEEKSHENIQLNFVKNGQTFDPMIGETIDSDITVGAVGLGTVPTFDTQGNIPDAAINERYDILHYTMGGSAGTFDTAGKLVSNDGSRQVFSQILSSQDDYIHALGYDSAGSTLVDANGNLIKASWDEASLAPLTSSPSAYVQFNWQDTRGWKETLPDTNGVWNINNVIQYKMYPIDFNANLYKYV